MKYVRKKVSLIVKRNFTITYPVGLFEKNFGINSQRNAIKTRVQFIVIIVEKPRIEVKNILITTVEQDIPGFILNMLRLWGIL